MGESKFRVMRLGDLVGELVTDNEAAIKARQSGQPRGPVTALPALDKALGGFLANGVHVLQAGPGAGKSALALQIAAMCGYPALYVTAEMAPLELFRRLIARATNTFLDKLKGNYGDLLSSRDIERLAHQTAEQMPWLTLLDATIGYVESDDIASRAEALREQAKAENLLIILDSLQYWAKGAGSESEYVLVSNGVRSLSEVAARLSCPVLAISQRNREGNKAKQEGGLYASKGSGDVEYASESVMDLIKVSDHADASGKTEINLAICKNRHGEAGRIIPLEFTGKFQQFAEKGREQGSQAGRKAGGRF